MSTERSERQVVSRRRGLGVAVRPCQGGDVALAEAHTRRIRAQVSDRYRPAMTNTGEMISKKSPHGGLSRVELPTVLGGHFCFRVKAEALNGHQWAVATLTFGRRAGKTPRMLGFLQWS